ncbi:MAG: hypothetical protein A3C27_02195 [Candidatus Levybacteria bacterium RIFCSPHIGHO2_02_FULL_39_36]|nr:MAG: hypothetical protein UT20_C0007G0012 [Candidatus Levybacteria bacterium GW2011_GWA1_39_11]OGH28130.1 MAG: hypothetical protein A3C27_02195 [Candidatus Levybacteria bacterium RIFCSPHIGHO2_02_FULL_39_36]
MDKKATIIISLLIVGILFGGTIYLSNLSDGATVEKAQGAKIGIVEANYDFGDVKYSGGNVTHAYKIKNEGTQDLVIANIFTSCMCTQAFFKKGDFKSESFGMKGHSSESAFKGVLKPKEEAEIVAVYDPTAHGPQGIGPIARTISFDTNDPDKPYVELGFAAVVAK